MTIRDPNFNSSGLLDQGASAVANPPSGFHKLVNRNGQLLLKNSSGTESFVGSGEGGINYFVNGNFEADASTGVTTGGGTAPTAAAETTAPLFGTRSSKITSGAGTGFVHYALDTIDNAIYDGQIALGFSGYFQTGATVAEGDWTVGIYNTTDSVYVTTQTDLKADLVNYHQALFVPVSGKTYVLRVEFTDTTAGRILLVDNLRLSGDNTSILTDMQEPWTAYTPTGSHVSNATYTGFWKRVGDEMLLQVQIAYTGATTAENLSITLPTGYHIDVNKIVGVSDVAIGRQPPSGPYGTLRDNGGTPLIYEVFALPTNVAADNYGRFYVMSWNRSTNAIVNMTNTGPITIANGDYLQITARFPIQEWADSKVNLITPSVAFSNARFGGEYHAATSLTTSDPIPWVQSFNDGGGTYAAGIYTVPANGKYRISTTIQTNTASTNVWHILINGSNRYQIYNGGLSADTWRGDVTLDLIKGQTIQIRPSATMTTSSNAAPAGSFFNIERIADISASEPFGFGLATTSNAGLLPPPTLMSDSLATALGYKTYYHGTTYKNGNAPTITGGGTPTSIVGMFVPYRVQNGRLRIRFNLQYFVSGTSTSIVITLPFVGHSSLHQAVSVYAGDGANPAGAGTGYVGPGTANIDVRSVNGNASKEWIVSGDLEVNADPNWMY